MKSLIKKLSSIVSGTTRESCMSSAEMIQYQSEALFLKGQRIKDLEKDNRALVYETKQMRSRLVGVEHERDRLNGLVGEIDRSLHAEKKSHSSTKAKLTKMTNRLKSL